MSKTICLGVADKAELLALNERAIEAGIYTYLVTDFGATTFHGVRTETCLAVGPANTDDLNKIIGTLELL